MMESVSMFTGVRQHPLKESVRRRKIPLWMLRKVLGGSPSEAALSRLLNGIDPMESDLEEKIRRLVEPGGSNDEPEEAA